MKQHESEIIARLKNGDEKCLHELYEAHRDDFLHWASRKFQLDEEDAKDVFQNCLITFYENVLSGKLSSLNSEIKTYLFAVGKNQILTHKKKSGITINLEPDSDINLYTDPVADQDEDDYTKELVRQALEFLGKECQQILKLFYFINLDLKKIALTLNYKNDNVVKAKKSQCLRKLAAAYNARKQETPGGNRPEV